MGGLRVGALTLLLGAGLWTTTADAQEGAAALLPLQGTSASKIRQSVQTGLREEGVELIPLKKVSSVAKKTKNNASRASRLDASVLVGGKIRRSNGNWIADMGVRNQKGARVEKFRTSASTMQRLVNRIVIQLIDTGRMPMSDDDDGAAFVEPAPAAASFVEPDPPPPVLDVPRIVVRPFNGPQASKVRVAVIRSFRDEPVKLVPNKVFVDKARSLGVDPRAEGGHVPPSEALGISALVDGDVVREDGIWSAYVRLLDASSDDVISQHYYEGDTYKELSRAVQQEAWDDFRKDVKKLTPKGGTSVAAPAIAIGPVAVDVAEATPEVEIAYEDVEPEKEKKSKDKKPKEEKSRERDRDRPAAVDIEFDFVFVHRSLTWNDDQLGNLRDYTLGFGPGVQTKFQYYPGAHFTSGVGAQFGVDFEWQRLFNFDSTRDDGLSFPTEAQQFLVGLRWRYPVGRWEPSIFAGYGMQKFEFGVSSDPTVPPGIPGVRYQFVRLGAGFRVGIGKKESFIIAANAAFRGVFNAGGIQSSVWFPDAKVNGLDAMLMLGYALPLGFEVRVSGDYRRYGFDLNPVPPDPPYVAGGALDQYWTLSIGAAWRY